MFLLDPSFFEIRNTKHTGRGVFAKKEISAGTIIGDYTGRIISYEEDNESDGLYSMEYGNELLILAEKNSIGIHLMNHSCMPNCCIYPYRDHGLFVSLRRIFPAEELTVSYMIDPDWKESVYPCTCGSVICTGFMTTTARQARAIDIFAQKQLNAFFSELPLKKGETLEPLPSYPERIADVDIYDLYGNMQIPRYMYQGRKHLTVPMARKIIRESGACIEDLRHHTVYIGVCDGALVSQIV